MRISPPCTPYPAMLPSALKRGVPVVSTAALALMKPPPSTWMPAGLAMITSARCPATST